MPPYENGGFVDYNAFAYPRFYTDTTINDDIANIQTNITAQISDIYQREIEKIVEDYLNKRFGLKLKMLIGGDFDGD